MEYINSIFLFFKSKKIFVNFKLNIIIFIKFIYIILKKLFLYIYFIINFCNPKFKL
jgi:hypothetical protein